MFTALATLALVLAADPVAITLGKAADKAAITSTDERTTIAIESKTGIGTAVLRPGKDGWPKQLRLDLNLKGLEGFTAHDGTKRVHTSLGSKTPEVLKLRDGKWEPIDLDLKLAPTIRKVGGRIHVDFPPAWLDAERKEIHLQWIDFYRG